MRYFKKIVGDKVYLSPINCDDYLKYVEWLNDRDISKYISNYTNMISLMTIIEKHILLLFRGKSLFIIQMQSIK